MTTTVRHQPARSEAAVAVAGQAGWAPLRPASDLELAERVRRYCLTVLPARIPAVGAGDRDRQALSRITSRYPAAVKAFGRPALLALTRRPGPSGRRACAPSGPGSAAGGRRRR